MDNPHRARRDYLREWMQELQGPIWGMLNSREVFRSWNELVGAAAWPEHTNGYFNEWVNRNYFSSLMVTIRQMNDDRRDTRSLRRLLRNIKKRPLPNMATDRIDECMDLLTRVSETVKQYVDENIAHYNPSKAEDLSLTYGHIHEAADTICDIYQDLHTIIDDATAVPPSVADSAPYFAWEFLFAEAWVTHDKAHDIAQRRLDEWRRLTPSVSMSTGLIIPSGPIRSP